MTLTDNQVRLLTVIEKRIAIEDELAVAVREGRFSDCPHYHGILVGLNLAINAWEGIEPIKSLEYLAAKPEAERSKFPVEAWKV